MKIDARKNTNTCTLHVGPELFCTAENGFWNTVLLNMWLSITIVFTLSFAYNLYSAWNKDDPFTLSKFDLTLIFVLSSYEIVDIGIDINNAVS